MVDVEVGSMETVFSSCEENVKVGIPSCLGKGPFYVDALRAGSRKLDPCEKNVQLALQVQSALLSRPGQGLKGTRREPSALRF